MKNWMWYLAIGAGVYYFWWRPKQKARAAAMMAQKSAAVQALPAPAAVPVEGEVGMGY